MISLIAHPFSCEILHLPKYTMKLKVPFLSSKDSFEQRERERDVKRVLQFLQFSFSSKLLSSNKINTQFLLKRTSLCWKYSPYLTLNCRNIPLHETNAVLRAFRLV